MSATAFRRCWLLCWRLAYETGDWLGTLPVLIAMPTAAAILGTAFAVSSPSVAARHGVVALVGASFWDVLWRALVGAIGGVFVVTGGVFWIVWIYDVLLARNRLWDIAYSYRGAEVGRPEARVLFGLRGRGPVKRDTGTLGPHVVCVVKAPSGAVWNSDGVVEGAVSIHGPFYYSEGEIWLREGLEPEAGTWDVRWYGTRHKTRMHEVARAKVKVDSDFQRLPHEKPSPVLGD